MTATIATVTGATGATASGNGTQRHIIYAQNSAVWWAFWVDPATATVLRSAYSADLVTWTPGATVTLLTAVGDTGDGRYMSVVYANIGGTDVVHAVCSCDTATVYDVRGVLTAASVAWAAAATVTNTSTTAAKIPDALVVALASDGGVFVSSSALDTVTTATGDETHNYNATADTVGASWTPGVWTMELDHTTAAIFQRGHGIVPLGAGTVMVLWPADANPPNNVAYAIVARNATPVAPANAFGSSVNFTDVTANEWGACKVSINDVHLVRRTGASSYEHIRYNGSAWVPGQSIPAQASKATAGIALTSDGTNVYLAVIDSDANNTVRYCTWNGTQWTSWHALETAAATRNNIAAVQECGATPTLVPFVWTEGAASPFAVKAAPLNLKPAGLLLRGVNI